MAEVDLVGKPFTVESLRLSFFCQFCFVASALQFTGMNLQTPGKITSSSGLHLPNFIELAGDYHDSKFHVYRLFEDKKGFSCS